jgi:hypothetical protein
MPAAFLALASNAAQAAGFGSFTPDGCLINRYEPGARLSLHQDKNEHDKTSSVFDLAECGSFCRLRRQTALLLPDLKYDFAGKAGAMLLAEIGRLDS